MEAVHECFDNQRAHNTVLSSKADLDQSLTLLFCPIHLGF